jgi:membrane-associated phospholipid phosphatase
MTASTKSRQPSGWLAPRHPGDAVRVGISLLVLVFCAVVVHRDRVGVHETDVFRLVNDLPSALFPLVWPVMQIGNFLAILVAAVIAAGTRRFRLASEILLAGVGVWVLAKVVKSIVLRGRPATLLSGVHIHGAAAGGRGYPSGHAAVAAAILTLISPYLSRRARRIALTLVFGVCFARVYVGAHLPLDVVAGAALGWGAASAVHLLLGTPTGRPSARALQKSLARFGFPVTELRPVDPDRQDAAIFRAVSRDGQPLFVKVLPRERRDRDLLYRCWLRLTRQSRGRGRPPVAQAEHEALLAAMASLAGVRTPEVLVAGRLPSGSGIVVRAWVDARRLDEPGVGREAIDDVARNVAALHAAGIAHGHLAPWTLLVDGEHQGWLVGFDVGVLQASAEQLGADRADLESALAAVVGPEAAHHTLERAFRSVPVRRTVSA